MIGREIRCQGLSLDPVDHGRVQTERSAVDDSAIEAEAVSIPRRTAAGRGPRQHDSLGPPSGIIEVTAATRAALTWCKFFEARKGRTLRVESTEVLVVGAGPAGLTAAACLARDGVRAITLSRYSGTAPEPRATFTNQRTVEVFRDFGIEDRLRAVSTPGRSVGHNVMATSLVGSEILRFQTYGTGERLADYALASPCEPLTSPQHLVEPVLLSSARERGADIRYRHEMLTIEQTEDEVVARVLDRESGEEYEIHAAYAIGADGGRSRVAEQLGIPFEGDALPMYMVNAWINADLTEHTAHRPAGIYMILQPGSGSWVGAGSFVHIKPFHEWVLVWEYDPADGEPDVSDEAVIETTRRLVGDPDLEVGVKSTSLWQVNNMIATEYRRGRVFIAGDAAHRHSPSGGYGSNTSIQDTFNLCWKLGLVLRGKAGEGLLDSYHQERQPVGKQIVDRAMVNLENKAAVAQVLGLRKGQTAEEGWESLRSLFSDDPGADERRVALEKIRAVQHFRSNSHGIQLGQRYTSCAIVDDGTPFPEHLRDPELYYEPTTHPGGHLPHAWIEHERRQLSTLDLAGHGHFSLIVGIGGDPWVEAAQAVERELGLQLPVFKVGYRCDYDDVLGQWAALREIDDRGAILVRPDLHIAWRSLSRPASPTQALLDGIRQSLALPN